MGPILRRCKVPTIRYTMNCSLSFTRTRKTHSTTLNSLLVFRIKGGSRTLDGRRRTFSFTSKKKKFGK